MRRIIPSFAAAILVCAAWAAAADETPPVAEVFACTYQDGKGWSDVERSERFYRDVLGLPVCAQLDEQGMRMAFFTLGDHHDFAISQSADLGDAKGSGLDHVAFCIGTRLDDLVRAKTEIEARGIQTTPIDHGVTQSVYLSDPDGNGIELYIDVSDSWKTHPADVAQAKPLEI